MADHRRVRRLAVDPEKNSGQEQQLKAEVVTWSSVNLEAATHMDADKDSEKKIAAYVCSICGKSFATNLRLVVHTRRHTGEKPYACRYCGKAFPCCGERNRHERYHTDTKLYVCHTCDKRFHCSSHLTVHMRSHTLDRPFKCVHCNKSFTQRNNLNVHTRRHTGERFQCPLCEDCFLMQNQLRKHCLSVHNRNIAWKTGRQQRTEPAHSPSHSTNAVVPPKMETTTSESAQVAATNVAQVMHSPSPFLSDEATAKVPVLSDVATGTATTPMQDDTP